MKLSKARALAFSSVGHFVNDGSVAFVPLIVDVLSQVKGTTPIEVSVLLFLFPFSSTVSSVFIGRYADRSGSAGVLMALGIGCLGLALVGFYLLTEYSTGVHVFLFATACTVAMGFGSSFYHPLGGTVLQVSFGQEATGRALGLNGAMGSLGRALYPTMLFVVAAVASTPGSLGFFGIVGVGSALLIWGGLGRAEVGRPTKGAEQPSARSVLTKPMVILLAVSFLRSASLFGISSYVAIFLTTQRGLGINSLLLGLEITVMYASAIPGQPFFGLLADRFDRRLVLAVSALGAGASIVGFSYSEGVVAVALLSLFGFFAYTGFPLLLSLASDYAKENATSFGNSLIWGLGATGGNSVGPLIVGAIILGDYSGLGFAFRVMAVLAGVSAFAAFLIPRARPRKIAATGQADEDRKGPPLSATDINR